MQARPRLPILFAAALSAALLLSAAPAAGSALKVGGVTINIPSDWRSDGQFPMPSGVYHQFSLANGHSIKNQRCEAGHAMLRVGTAPFSVGGLGVEEFIQKSHSATSKQLNCGAYKGKHAHFLNHDTVIFAWRGQDSGGHVLRFSGSTSFYVTAPSDTPDQVSAALADRDALKKRFIDSMISMLSGSGAAPAPKPKPANTPKNASFNIKIETDMGTSWIENAKVIIRNLDSGKEGGFTATKPYAGMDFRVIDDDTPMRLRVVKVIILQNAVYHLPLNKTVPAGLSTPIEITGKALGKTDFAFSKKTGMEHTFTYKLPLCPVNLTVFKWDSRQKKYVPARATLAISEAETSRIFVKHAASSAVYTKDGHAEALMPPVTLFGSKATRIKAFGVDPANSSVKDKAYVKAPGANQSASMALRLIEPIGRLREWVSDISLELGKTIGATCAGKVGKVRLVTGAKPKWVTDENVACFLDGAVWVPARFDHTADSSVEEILHEFGHATAWAMDVEAGGDTRPAHNQWEAAVSKEIAWDEARAHFYAQIYSEVLKVRVKGAFTLGTALSVNANRPTAARPTPGEWVEGVIAATLLEYYKNESDPKRVLADFAATEQKGKNAGKSIDTAREFLAYKSGLLSAQGGTGKKRAAELAAIQKKARITK